MLIRQQTHTKTNIAYMWCKIEDDNTLTFGFDDGDTNKQSLSFHSYANKQHYWDEVKRKMRWYKENYPKYYQQIIDNYKGDVVIEVLEDELIAKY